MKASKIKAMHSSCIIVFNDDGAKQSFFIESDAPDDVLDRLIDSWDCKNKKRLSTSFCEYIKSFGFSAKSAQ